MWSFIGVDALGYIYICIYTCVQTQIRTAPIYRNLQPPKSKAYTVASMEASSQEFATIRGAKILSGPEPSRIYIFIYDGTLNIMPIISKPCFCMEVSKKG